MRYMRLFHPMTIQHLPHHQRGTALEVEVVHTHKSTLTSCLAIALMIPLLVGVSQDEVLCVCASFSCGHSSKPTACSFQDQRAART